MPTAMTQPATVLPLTGRMSEQEYAAERARIRATYGDTAAERTGAFDQDLAALFYRSGWTQDRLAKTEGKSQPWIVCRLRFGRFMANITTVIIPKSLTEGRFRKYWERTTGDNERQRFADVAQLMAEEMTVSKPHHHKRPVADAIKATSATGDWFKFTTIQTRVHGIVPTATADDVRAVLSGMVQHGWYNVFCERKGGNVYRIVLGGNCKIDLVVLRRELGPIIDRLEAEGRKNMATMSPGTVAHLAIQLRRVIDRLANTPRATTDDAEG